MGMQSAPERLKSVYKEPVRCFTDFSCIRLSDAKQSIALAVLTKQNSLVLFHIISSCSTNEGVMNEVKRRWVEAGKPENADWETILQGVS
jgi:hypothetical protein